MYYYSARQFFHIGVWNIEWKHTYVWLPHGCYSPLHENIECVLIWCYLHNTLVFPPLLAGDNYNKFVNGPKWLTYNAISVCNWNESPLPHIVTLLFPSCCVVECSYGTYGMDCRGTCNCPSGICDRVTGKCLKFPFYQLTGPKPANKRRPTSSSGMFPPQCTRYYTNQLLLTCTRKKLTGQWRVTMGTISSKEPQRALLWDYVCPRCHIHIYDIIYIVILCEDLS